MLIFLQLAEKQIVALPFRCLLQCREEVSTTVNALPQPNRLFVFPIASISSSDTYQNIQSSSLRLKFDNIESPEYPARFQSLPFKDSTQPPDVPAGFVIQKRTKSIMIPQFRHAPVHPRSPE
jgi:hypothetical protein